MKWIIMLGRVNKVIYYMIAAVCVPVMFLTKRPIWEPLLLIALSLACAVFIEIKLRRYEKQGLK